MKRNCLLLLLLPVALFCCNTRSEVIASKKEPLISDSLSKIISIDTAKMEYIEDAVSLSGEVDNDENKTVKIFPNTSGQVVSVNVSLGDKVRKGQSLAVIKSADVAGNYDDLKSAGNDAEISEKAFKNAEELYKAGISSEKDYVQAKLEYEKAMNSVNRVRTAIEINGGGKTSASGSYIISSPRDGYVVEKNITAGSFIRNDNSQNLFTISDMQDVWVWANVFETDINRIKQGYPAEVTTIAYPGKIFEGKIDQINSVLDPATKAMKVKIILPNTAMLLKPQMFTKIIINNKEDTQALMVPSESIVFDDGKNYVVLYKDSYNVKVQEVQILKTSGNKTYIKEGLKPGDMVISKNQILLYNSLTDD